MSSYALTKLQRAAGDPKEGGAHAGPLYCVIAGLDPAIPMMRHSRALLIGVAGSSPATTTLCELGVR
jgi:hypothetical protein